MNQRVWLIEDIIESNTVGRKHGTHMSQAICYSIDSTTNKL